MLTKAEIERASKIAEKESLLVLKTLGGQRIAELRGLATSGFKPNLSGDTKEEFIKEVKKRGRPRKMVEDD